PQSWSLSVKIPVIHSVMIVGVALTIGVVVVAQAWVQFREELEEKALLLARDVATAAPEAILRNDYWTLYNTLRRTASHMPARIGEPRLLSGMVLDMDGQVLAHIDPMNHPLGLALDPAEEAERRLLDDALRTVTPSIVTGSGGGSDFIESVVPITFDQKRLGVVRIRVSMAELQGKIWRAGLTVLVLTLGLAAAGSLLGAVISSRMGRRLKALAEGMETVGRGEVSQVRPLAAANRDEIGQLVARFNDMAAELAEKKRLEEKLALSEKLASLGQIVAGVAHEVNNPLGGMLNCINTLKMHPEDPALLRRYLPLLEKGLNRIGATVQGLLVELQNEGEPAPCDLACLSDLKELVAAEIGDRKIALRWDNGVPGETCLGCSCPNLQQVLLNLMNNSIRAMPEGGTLAFRSCRENNSLVMEVEDSGVGIPKEHRRHLFDPFFTSRPNGTGLGLWVTYQLVQRMHGTIQVESEPGQGSLFRVRLPLESDAVAEKVQ
ncbi:MAG: HAMP domain-containing histidine kinase, partial [Rhodospirillales bacterium]|nr:HAMP domain-containing histidine kinase [Rhodospirillales bacterium]